MKNNLYLNAMLGYTTIKIGVNTLRFKDEIKEPEDSQKPPLQLDNKKSPTGQLSVRPTLWDFEPEWK